jgi:hypothetical protein
MARSTPPFAGVATALLGLGGSASGALISLDTVAPSGATVLVSQAVGAKQGGDPYGYWDNAGWAHHAYGQTFTSPASSYNLEAITVKTGSDVDSAASTWDLYVIGSIATAAGHLTYTELAHETASAAGGVGGRYVTFTLGTAVEMSPSTQYGFILNIASGAQWVEMHSSFSNDCLGGTELRTDFGGGTPGSKPASASNVVPIDGVQNANNADLVFYVSGSALPEPGALAIMALACPAIFLRRRSVR